MSSKENASVCVSFFCNELALRTLYRMLRIAMGPHRTSHYSRWRRRAHYDTDFGTLVYQQVYISSAARGPSLGVGLPRTPAERDGQHFKRRYSSEFHAYHALHSSILACVRLLRATQSLQLRSEQYIIRCMASISIFHSNLASSPTLFTYRRWSGHGMRTYARLLLCRTHPRSVYHGGQGMMVFRMPISRSATLVMRSDVSWRYSVRIP